MATEKPTTMKLDPKYDDYDFPTVSPTVLSGHPGHTTPEQDAQVFQLRTKLEQAGYTDRLDTLTLVRVPAILVSAASANYQKVAFFTSPEVRCSTLRTDVGNPPPLYVADVSHFSYRFIDAENWRKEMGPNGLDDLVKNFKYEEKAELFKYYPQYYHKTDKVRFP
jgi:hypothetical protein